MTRRLTKTAQDAVRAALRPGALAVDATAGNGFDTAFLAEAVGPTGRVLAFDVQSAAVRSTRARLRSLGCEAQVQVIEGCHSELERRLAPGDQLQAAMFNLGYLPGSDKRTATRFATTSRALTACLEHVGRGGIISVMAYRGHPGGLDEATSVSDMISALPRDRFAAERHEAANNGPVLWLVRAVPTRWTKCTEHRRSRRPSA